MNQREFQVRTKRFAVGVIEFLGTLPKSQTSQIISRQLLRSATSTAANYRAACRSKSSADFIAKMGIVEEEADESMYWLELLVEAGIADEIQIKPLHKEADELVAMTVSSINTARGRTR